jgi:hypothetical protein
MKGLVESSLGESRRPQVFRARIESVKYKPLLCRSDLPRYDLSNLTQALSESAAFLIRLPTEDSFAVSVWVSPKRTRTYPYARVYDTLGYSACRKVAVIPVVKDEGQAGDRDFIQWETVALMSLLGVYVVITYYDSAVPSKRHEGKITDRRFSKLFTSQKFDELTRYRSDALHWNLTQLEQIQDIAESAYRAYHRISSKAAIEMHSESTFRSRIDRLYECAETFKQGSRQMASSAQGRELYTVQPKELTHGMKAGIVIENYLGGDYHFTVDEWHLVQSKVALLECKHTTKKKLPGLADIKDALLKMILWTNLKKVRFALDDYPVIPVVNLTFSGDQMVILQAPAGQRLLVGLGAEARENVSKFG